MDTRIAENIRSYRKQQGMTQEQLAEAMGVSVGSVYKWEAKASMPELRMLMELADFFDVSVDTLLGYQMKDNRLNAAVERLWKASRCQDYDAVSEAEKAIRKYPHSFDAVFAGAHLYYTFGAATRKKPWLRRAIELLDRARLLVSQCTDSRVNESWICGMMAEMHEMLGETDKALELLKTHNVNAVFNAMIGIMLLSNGKDPEEANDFLEDGFLRAISSLIQTVIGYAMLLDVKNDNASGMEMMRWIIPTLEGLKKTNEPSFSQCQPLVHIKHALRFELVDGALTLHCDFAGSVFREYVGDIEAKAVYFVECDFGFHHYLETRLERTPGS